MSKAEIFRGDLRAQARSAPAELVATFQRDLVRVAFALTGDPDQTAALARDALISVLTGPSDDEAEPTGAPAAGAGRALPGDDRPRAAP